MSRNDRRSYLELVKLTIKQLRNLVKEQLAGSHPEESYDKELIDDPAIAQKSVYVPDDIKDSIKTWMKDMQLTHH